jgi:hypothetical protein
MKSSVVYATGIVCCLVGGLSTNAWSGDLDSALDNVNISSDAQSNPKKNDNTTIVPCSKAAGVNCPTAHDDDVNSTAYQATTLQQTILNGNESNVTINGAPVIDGNHGSVSISGF